MSRRWLRILRWTRATAVTAWRRRLVPRCLVASLRCASARRFAERRNQRGLSTSSPSLVAARWVTPRSTPTARPVGASVALRGAPPASWAHRVRPVWTFGTGCARRLGDTDVLHPVEEGLERPVEAHQRSARGPDTELLLPPRQRSLLVEPRDRPALPPPRTDPFLQCCVVQLALNVEQTAQRRLLPDSRLQQQDERAMHPTSLPRGCDSQRTNGISVQSSPEPWTATSTCC